LMPVLILLLPPLTGCLPFAHEGAKSYVTVVADAHHDAELARAECERAAKLFEKGQLAKAEASLQDALVADVSYAPAHNNLGRLYYDQGKLYLAAWEFEYARRLLPDSPAVANNLGMVYEAAGQVERAIECYGTAVDFDQRNPVYAGNLARALVRAGKDPARAAVLLQQVVLNDSRPEWVRWARGQLELNAPIRTAAQNQATATGDSAPELIHPLPAPQHIDDLPVPEGMD